MLFVIKPAPIGSYSLTIDGAPPAYTLFNYELNSAPQATIGSAACVGSAAAEVTVACSAGAPSGGSVDFSWNVADNDSPDALVSMGFAPIVSGTLDLNSLQLLADGLALGTGSYSWDLSEVPSGSYQEDNTLVTGLAFVPQAALEGSFTATLKGGTSGVTSAAGNTMPSDYRWSFTLTPLKLSLPMVWR